MELWRKAIGSAVRSPAERNATGFAALTAALGQDDTIAFLGDLLSTVDEGDGIPGRDFAKWLNEQPQPSLEELKISLMRMQAEDKAAGLTP